MSDTQIPVASSKPKRMGEGLTLDDVRAIQADANRAVQKQFADAAERGEFVPSATPSQDGGSADTPSNETSHVTGQSSDDKKK
jgi:hypothetical protein